MIPEMILNPLAPASIHVWCCPLQASSQELDAAQSLLSDHERTLANRFHRSLHRQRYIVARAALRRLLTAYLREKDAAALHFSYGPAGKPQLENRGIHFNLSHSGDWALVAISSQPVGIDLEEIRTLDFEATARSIFAPEALLALARAPAHQKAETFFQLWVQNEARHKAFGLGIASQHCPEIPVYDLNLLDGFSAAVASLIPHPKIEVLRP
ncbi:MAG TPA: 4'-phosphopantetheinyl transferase superfamily protein [Phycisphaerae bacterium]|jgi:4'-phosphopantetheinyl transferase